MPQGHLLRILHEQREGTSTNNEPWPKPWLPPQVAISVKVALWLLMLPLLLVVTWINVVLLLSLLLVRRARTSTKPEPSQKP